MIRLTALAAVAAMMIPQQSQAQLNGDGAMLYESCLEAIKDGEASSSSWFLHGYCLGTIATVKEVMSLICMEMQNGTELPSYFQNMARPYGSTTGDTVNEFVAKYQIHEQQLAHIPGTAAAFRILANQSACSPK